MCIRDRDQIKHVLVRHEQAAVHAADGLARSSHKVGVALVTSGPGATNAVTGIATAYMDSIPVVVISGQVPNEYIGQDAFKECDTVGITRPCVKHNLDVYKRQAQEVAYESLSRADRLSIVGDEANAPRLHGQCLPAVAPEPEKIDEQNDEAMGLQNDRRSQAMGEGAQEDVR